MLQKSLHGGVYLDKILPSAEAIQQFSLVNLRLQLLQKTMNGKLNAYMLHKF